MASITNHSYKPTQCNTNVPTTTNFESLPTDLHNYIFRFDPSLEISFVSKENHKKNEESINNQWLEIEQKLADNPTISTIMDKLRLDTVQTGKEKFRILFEYMIVKLGEIPPSIRGISRFSLQCYSILANEISRGSDLQKSWPHIRTVISETANQIPHDLPSEDAFAHEIRSWLTNLTNAPYILNVEQLFLSNRQLNSTPDEIKLFTNLIHLNISNNNIKVVEADDFQGLHRLEELNLGHNDIQSIHPRAFESNPRIRFLHLGYNRIQNLYQDTLRPLEQLNELTLENNRLDGFPSDIPLYCTTLRRLDLQNNNIRTINDHLLNDISDFIYVVLTGNPLEAEVSERLGENFEF